MRRTWKTSAALAASALIVAVAMTGCSDDDDGADTDTGGTDATAETAGFDAEAYCEASEAAEQIGEPEIDFETATPQEIAEATKTFMSETALPALEAAATEAGDEISDEADTVLAAGNEVAETGDFGAFETPEMAEALATIHEYDAETCDWTTVDIVTEDYTFEGFPEELEAGPTSFELTNEGAEVHEIALVKRNDGVTDPVEDILALPEEEAFDKVTFVGVAGPVPTGEEAYVFADLTPGDYIVVCFLPTGMTSMDGPPPDGPPHAMNGMVTEFTVS
jgi:hypothetical protein